VSTNSLMEQYAEAAGLGAVGAGAVAKPGKEAVTNPTYIHASDAEVSAVSNPTYGMHTNDSPTYEVASVNEVDVMLSSHVDPNFGDGYLDLAEAHGEGVHADYDLAKLAADPVYDIADDKDSPTSDYRVASAGGGHSYENVPIGGYVEGASRPSGVVANSTYHITDGQPHTEDDGDAPPLPAKVGSVEDEDPPPLPLKQGDGNDMMRTTDEDDAPPLPLKVNRSCASEDAYGGDDDAPPLPMKRGSANVSKGHFERRDSMA